MTIGDQGREGYFEFLEIGFRVIDQSESGRLSSSELSAKSECLDRLLRGFI